MTTTEHEKAIIGDFLEKASRPSLEGLAYSLRHPETWPKGFVWDFSECRDCAMGLAVELWNIEVQERKGDGGNSFCCTIAREMAIPYEECRDMFLGGPWMPIKTQRRLFRAPRRIYDCNAVTPEMVAGRIDKYLAERT